LEGLHWILIVLRELQIINKKNPWPKGWGQKTSIMGVINLTPDSFSDGGELNSSKKVIDQNINNKNSARFELKLFVFLRIAKQSVLSINAANDMRLIFLNN